ncbi:hypothetical protein O9649_19575 [Achromobacter dolens]|uniref:hypothetical protein n=1 Tax=Achromobacter dolens TaxID=1287738 RepID=UPI0022B896C0|nr:hypothetical protein [Achromobacter dolens]MCZ8409994.1 hypothetical protein [Achromobacter dolens]
MLISVKRRRSHAPSRPLLRPIRNHGRMTSEKRISWRGDLHHGEADGKRVRHKSKCAAAKQNGDPDSLISDPVVGFAPPLMQRGLLS